MKQVSAKEMYDRMASVDFKHGEYKIEPTDDDMDMFLNSKPVKPIIDKIGMFDGIFNRFNSYCKASGFKPKEQSLNEVGKLLFYLLATKGFAPQEIERIASWIAGEEK